jgi:response regulator RpfG family c-di-GMP phosphodiesterase
MAERAPTILIVDDEEMVLTSLKAYLSLETDYRVLTFTSAKEALAVAQKEPIDLVISDYLMPEMDGITFLGKMKQIAPEAPRIVLTGYADKENAIKGINEVGLYQYLEKPWDNADLQLVIKNGLEKKKLLSDLAGKISQINSAYAELQSIQQKILKTFV